MTLPLDDITVVSLEQAVAAPYCTCRLADDGAEVFKIERDSGDFARQYDSIVYGQSAYFVWLNRGKKSVALNIKNPNDLRILKEAISKCDVFVQNLAPGATARLGLDYQSLHRDNKKIIVCDISGYGADGPSAEMKAYDLLVQCESGLASITGGPEAPGRVGVSICDIACGLNAYAGILSALRARYKTGKGAHLQVSLFSTIAEWMSVPLLTVEHGGSVPAPVGVNHPSIAPYGMYAANNGKQIVIAIQSNREWASFCEHVLGNREYAMDTRFADNSARCKNRAALDDLINSVFNATPTDMLVERLKSGQIAYSNFNYVEDLSVHPQLNRISVKTESEDVSLPAPPVTTVGDARQFGPIPAINAHGDEFRQRFDKASEGVS